MPQALRLRYFGIAQHKSGQVGIGHGEEKDEVFNFLSFPINGVGAGLPISSFINKDPNKPAPTSGNRLLNEFVIQLLIYLNQF